MVNVNLFVTSGGPVVPGGGCRRWIAAGKRNVTLISILGGGHAVPHPEMHGPLLLGNSNRDFHAANEIWEFFQQAP